MTLSNFQDEKAKKLLKQFTPDQRGIAETLATLKIENRVLSQQIADVKSAYDQLYKTFVVLLEVDPDHEMRIHKTQFLRFKHEYRIDRTFDKETEEVVFKLLTLHEDIPGEDEK